MEYPLGTSEQNARYLALIEAVKWANAWKGSAPPIETVLFAAEKFKTFIDTGKR